MIESGTIASAPKHPSLQSLPRGIFLAIFLVSLGVLVLQIALNRIFSFTLWYHFAYVSISLALLGFGASGSLIAAFPRLSSYRLGPAVGVYSALAALSTFLLLLTVGSVQLDPARLGQHAWELGRFALFFGVVAAPFFFAGCAITLMLRAAGEAVDRLYFWDLVGAGLGCALVVPALNILEAPAVVGLVAVLFALAGLIAAASRPGAVRNLCGVFVGGSLIGTALLPGQLDFRASPDKQISAWEGATVYLSQWSAIFRTDMLGAAGGEMRLAGYAELGISPLYEGPVPPYRMIVHDGGAGAIMYLTTQGREGFSIFEHHVLTTPYVVSEKPDVLIIGVGGGADIVNGLTNDAESITGIELDPLTIELTTERYADVVAGIFDDPRVTIHEGEGRSFARSSEQQFDLVQLTGVDTLAALSSGAYILSENYLYTVEAYRDYFSRLRPGGVLSIGSIDHHPSTPDARHSVRFASVSYEALRRRGIANPHEHIAIIGTPGLISMFEILTKIEPFSDEEISALEQFATENDFQPWYLPGRAQHQQPALVAALEGDEDQRESYYRDTFLNLRATTDDRPFFFSFYKWRALLDHRKTLSGDHNLATGQIVLALIFLVSIVVSIAAILLPLAVRRGSLASIPNRWGYLGYFAALGIGFIFLEICFLQRFILFLGYPTYSLSVMLFSFLTAAGIGARLSGQIDGEPRVVLPRLTAALTGVVVVYSLGLDSIFNTFLSSALPVRVGVTVLLCAPLGGVLGVFFPYGIRLTSRISADFVPWAWALNGCLTVVGSVAAIIIAMSHGFTVVSALAVAIYWAGTFSFLRAHSAG